MHTSRALVATLAASATILVVANAGAAPPPCNGAAGIVDTSGDGHHPGSDVLAAWFSESSGHLQAVVQVRSGIWVAEHDDAEINGSAYAVVFTLGGQLAYVRANGPAQNRAADGVTYDYGTYTPPNTFQSAGATTGAVEAGPNGAVTIDVPAALGATAGTKLGNPFVLTYDGISGGVPDWVDHAPGGSDPADAARGADYFAGSCGGATATPPPGTTPTTTSVQLSAPKAVTGRKTVTITGKVLPARAGVPVTLTRQAHGTATTQATTADDGTFSARVAIAETTRLRAVAESVGSSELTVTAHSRVRIKLKRAKNGSVTVTGTVDPKLPGKVLWLRTNAATPSARATTRSGTFRLRLKHPRPGRYQAVVIPNGDRAERATSNTGVIR